MTETDVDYSHTSTTATKSKAMQRALEYLEKHDAHGGTIAEIRRWAVGFHHGALSSALSTMHRKGQISRLTEKRESCYVYVLNQYVNGRETQAQGRARVTLPRAQEVTQEQMFRTIQDCIYDARNQGKTIGDAATAAARRIYSMVYDQ